MDHNKVGRFKRGKLHRQLTEARFRHAIGALEPQVTAMVTVLAALYMWLNAPAYSLPQWSWVAVLAVGLSASSLLIAIGLTDSESIAASVRLALEEHFRVDSIADENIRAQVIQAVAHRVRLQEVFHLGNAGMRGQFRDSLVAVDDWLTGMGNLAQVLAPFQLEAQRQSESKLHLHARITELEFRIGETADRRIKDQLRETIAGRRLQQRAIVELENLVERGLLRLEHAVAALGTINAQLAIFSVRGEQDGEAARLAQDINGEIQEINAILVAIDRVHSIDRGLISHDS